MLGQRFLSDISKSFHHTLLIICLKLKNFVCVCVHVCAWENAINRGPFHRKLPSNRGRTCNGGPSTVAILVFAV